MENDPPKMNPKMIPENDPNTIELMRNVPHQVIIVFSVVGSICECGREHMMMTVRSYDDDGGDHMMMMGGSYDDDGTII